MMEVTMAVIGSAFAIKRARMKRTGTKTSSATNAQSTNQATDTDIPQHALFSIFRSKEYDNRQRSEDNGTAPHLRVIGRPSVGIQNPRCGKNAREIPVIRRVFETP